MRYKDKHFYTVKEHIDYMMDIESMNDNEIGAMLREYWHCTNMDVASLLEYYYEKKLR